VLGVTLADVMLRFPYNIRRKISYCFVLNICTGLPFFWNTLCFGGGLPKRIAHFIVQKDFMRSKTFVSPETKKNFFLTFPYFPYTATICCSLGEFFPYGCTIGEHNK
jgi:hypothetical protein